MANLAVLRSDLTKIAGQAGAAAQRALLQTGADIYDISQQFVPVDTGELKQSGGVLVVSSNEVHVGYGAAHSIFPEFGTVHQTAQPYLTPSFLQAESTFAARLKQEMERLK